MEFKLMKAAFEAIVNNTSNFIFLKDENSVYHAASKPHVRMIGKHSADEVIGRTDLELFEDENLAKRYVADDRKLLADGKNLINYIESITDDHGNARYASTSKYILKDEDGKPIGILGISKDITKEYLARKRYQQEFRYLFELPKDTYAVCYIDVDDWRIICQRRQNITKGTLQECMTIEEMSRYAVESIVDANSDAAEFYRHFTTGVLHGIYSSGRRTISFKYERKISDGSTRWIHNEINFLTDVDSGHLCAMLSAKDINKMEQEREKLVKAAKLDSMTRLPNRETTMEYISKILCEEYDRQHALFMLDIDNFKRINDTLGSQAGDEFLIKLANGLKDHFRESDVVGRVGGDEFFALMRNVTEPEQIERKAKDLVEIITSITAEYPQLELGGSVGVSIYPKNGNTLDDLYSKADSAMYEAKRSGTYKYEFA